MEEGAGGKERGYEEAPPLTRLDEHDEEIGKRENEAGKSRKTKDMSCFQEASPGVLNKRKYKEESSEEEEIGNLMGKNTVGSMAEPIKKDATKPNNQSGEQTGNKSVSNNVGKRSSGNNLNEHTKEANKGKEAKVNKVRIIEATGTTNRYRIVDETKNSEGEKKTSQKSVKTVEGKNNELDKVREHSYNKEKDESEELYKEDLESGDYTICMNLNKEKLSTKRKYNLVKIYNIVNMLGIKLKEIRMVGFSRAEITMGSRRDANRVIEYGRRKDSGYIAYIPRRKRTRRGVTKEWEGTLDELRECLMIGQGEFDAKRLKRRRLRDGKAVWEDSDTILLTFKGDSLSTRLYIGQGHVWLKVEPFIESVKQCFRCFRFGHLQAVCKAKARRCMVCSEQFHGECDRQHKCINCGEAHRANARECLIFQRESELKKMMAYKNVSYSQAREVMRDKYVGRRYDLDIESEKEFPRLRTEKFDRKEKWEKMNVPPSTREYNAWNTSNRNVTYRRNQDKYSSNEGEGGRGRTVGEPTGSFRYRDLNEERDMRRAQREGKLKTMNRVPHDRVRPWVNNPPKINIYDEYNHEDEMRKKKATNRIRGENYKLLDEIKDKTDDEILEQILMLVKERNLFNNFEEKIKRERRREENTVPVDPNEDWRGSGRHYHTYIPEKQARRFAVQRERDEQIKRLNEEKGRVEQSKEDEMETEASQRTGTPPPPALESEIDTVEVVIENVNPNTGNGKDKEENRSMEA